MSPSSQVHNMLTRSPQLLPKFGWKQEEEMVNELYYNYETSSSYNLKGTNTSIQSLSTSPLQPDVDADSPCQFNSDKKLIHNAYERDRRKKLNYLYCDLLSLLPDSNRNKKLSIPNTVSRVLKYIPELQKCVDNLRRRKEQILLRNSPKRDDAHVICDNLVNQVISVTRLDRNEVMVQICITSKVTRVPFSEFMKVLDQEGLLVINASTFTAQADKTFYTLHLEAKDSVSIMGEGFSERLTQTLKEQGKLIPIQNFMYK